MPTLIPRRDTEEIVESTKYCIEEFDGKKVIISGGLGFLGYQLYRALIAGSTCDVLLIDNLITGNAWGLDRWDRTSYLNLDISKPFMPDGKIDFVFHLAGIASPRFYTEFPLETLDVAVWGTRNMLGIARRHKAKMLFTSSSEIYGDATVIPTPEYYRGNVSSMGPRAVYDESKRLGETLCHVYSQKYDTNVRVVRPFNIFGPGMSHQDGRAMSSFATKAITNKNIEVYGSGLQTRTYCYITDAVAGLIKAMTTGKSCEAYNIGNDGPEISAQELAAMFCVAADKPLSTIKIVSHPHGYPSDEPNRRCPDLTKSKLDLGYKPLVTLGSGIGRFMDWAKESYVT